MSSSPSTPHQYWYDNIHGRILYPLIIVISIFAIFIIYYVIFRILCRIQANDNGADINGDGDDDSSIESSLPRSMRDTKLNPVFLSSLQSFDYSAAHGEKLECSVCLVEFVDGDKGRILPRCNHKFHVVCVDTWFQSHSTCPNCRANVVVKDSDDDVV